MRRLKNFRAESVQDERSEKSVGVPPQFADMSGEELRAELLRRVAEAKNNGELDADGIESFAAMLSPSLDEEGRRRLAELISLIR